MRANTPTSARALKAGAVNQTPERREAARQRSIAAGASLRQCFECETVAPVYTMLSEPLTGKYCCRTVTACERRIVAGWPKHVRRAYLAAQREVAA
jgi:hypothetical protein